MKRLLLLAGILGLITGDAYSQQQNQSKPKYLKINPSATLPLYYAEIIKKAEGEKYHVVPDGFLKPQAGYKPFYICRPGPPPDDHMPVLKPKGYFHGIVIKPDTAIDFKLIIRNP